MNCKGSDRVKRFSVNSIFVLKNFSEELENFIKKAIEKGYKNIVFVCLGTDRITGDSLGPLTGYKINGLKYGNIHIHGCLEKPVHAKNLYEEIDFINTYYEKPYIIVIDACLGDEKQIGDIIIGEGGIKPGAGVKKNLEPVGNAYIMGVVNISGWMEFQTLQNTRLNTVMRIADVIANGIKYTLLKLNVEAKRVPRYVN